MLASGTNIQHNTLFTWSAALDITSKLDFQYVCKRISATYKKASSGRDHKAYVQSNKSAKAFNSADNTGLAPHLNMYDMNEIDEGAL